MRWTKIPFAGPTTATLRILSLFKIIDLMLYQSLRPRLVCDSPYPCRFPSGGPCGEHQIEFCSKIYKQNRRKSSQYFISRPQFFLQQQLRQYFPIWIKLEKIYMTFRWLMILPQINSLKSISLTHWLAPCGATQ